MTNPLQRIKGGVTNIKNTSKALDIAKDPKQMAAVGKVPMAANTRMGPKHVAKSFAAGFKDPGMAKQTNTILKAKLAPPKPGLGNSKTTGAGITGSGKAIAGGATKPAPNPTKQPMSPQAKSVLLKKNLNSAFPGLNMK